ncbi:glycoside hydrolase family 127 protein [Myceligenerans sp. TRM 65318]|uniref:Glycoside hydrolase family 127 protein n=1 Tax=Myceligenerans pegani TaxID=2776917 RepID=A0ABR9MWK6_9MICO|nr:glycoside hydrolase family 127 protein [Myceligenerans sp. TRM 65318]MBE3018051.1 glycoside hydrolase family 127 protein [Myceligenerans sp. TRM 65318]
MADDTGRLARPVAPATSRRGAGLGEVRVDGGFWTSLLEVNAGATLRHCRDWMERLGWIANFDRVAAGTTADGERPGWQFSDSEVYKLLEALAWEHGRTGDVGADAAFEELAARVVAAQDDDGYLNTCYGHAGQPGRYTDLSSGHELYCTGHLLQAAVARIRTTTGPSATADPLVTAAIRAADHVCREFGPGAREQICGHPEIEVGLAELGRALGEPRYTAQATLFVERRGHGTLAPIALLGPQYFQDDVPVRDADAWRGHAVRALYLAAAAVDVAVDTGDDELLAAVERQWTRSVERRTHLTGGMGSRHQDEGFGDDWELPADRAYCETCAGIASVMVSWRLLLATDDVRYADLVERTLYNVVATSPRSDGRAFFYANPLQQRTPGGDLLPDEVNPRAEGGVRAPWFDVSCCPTNVARTLASWPAYTATIDGDVVTLAQYAPGDLRIALDDGGALGLRVTTRYPHHGYVRAEITEAPDRPVTLRLRVPSWADGATVTAPRAAGAGHGDPHTVHPGWTEVRRTFTPGDVVALDLPTAPRLTWPDPRVDALRGTVAVERGPLVLCVESHDLPPGADLADLRLDPSVPPVPHDDGARVRARLVPPPATPAGRPPFTSAPPAPPSDTTDGGTTDNGTADVVLIPYHRWAERGPAAMRVFLPIR